jgi:hypothetical protein
LDRTEEDRKAARFFDDLESLEKARLEFREH